MLELIRSISIIFALSIIGQAAIVPRRIQPKPNIPSVKATDSQNLGEWDDVIAAKEQNLLILRRGQNLFSLNFATPAKINKLISSPVVQSTEAVTCMSSDQRLWMLMNSKNSAPFAIDINSGMISKFTIPEMKTEGTNSLSIQSFFLSPLANAAIVQVSGGDRLTWPRDGNRPIYFWFNLTDGKVQAFPIGWDLSHFSSDQMFAFFDKPQEKEFQRRPLQAIALNDFRLIPSSSEQNTSTIYFHWFDTNPIKAIYNKAIKPNSGKFLAGLAVEGITYIFGLPFQDRYYLSTAQTDNEFVGFQIRKDGESDLHNPLWIAKLNKSTQPQQITALATDFVMLGLGKVIFTSTQNPSEIATEAFFYDSATKKSWDILDGIKLLSPIEEEYKGKNYIEESIDIRLIESFGLGSRLALCSILQSRSDYRDRLANFDQTGGKRYLPRVKRLTLLITPEGKRYETNPFPEAILPKSIWLHNSGNIITGIHLPQMSDSTSKPKIQIFQTSIQLPKP